MKIRYNCTYVTTEFCHGRKGGLGEIESYRWMRVKIQEGSEYEYAATRAQASLDCTVSAYFRRRRREPLPKAVRHCAWEWAAEPNGIPRQMTWPRSAVIASSGTRRALSTTGRCPETPLRQLASDRGYRYSPMLDSNNSCAASLSQGFCMLNPSINEITNFGMRTVQYYLGRVLDVPDL